MTGAAQEPETGSDLDPVINSAAHWLATGGADKSRSVIPQMKEQFGLAPKAAIAAIRAADLIRARAH